MSAAPEREDLGALGCTRDGYQLIGVGMLVGILLWPIYWISGYWLSGLVKWVLFAGACITVIGIAATARVPHGPFPPWGKRLVVPIYVVGIAQSLFIRVHLFQEHRSPYLRWFGEALDRAHLAFLSWGGPVGIALLCAFSARFALRRGVPLAALGWAVLGLWTVAMATLPLSAALAISSWSGYGAVFSILAGCFAPLYLARRLRLEIRAAAGVAA